MFFNLIMSHISKFRLRYRGFFILKDQNKFGLWKNLKEQFLNIFMYIFFLIFSTNYNFINNYNRSL
jgi:hypothetical protein